MTAINNAGAILTPAWNEGWGLVAPVTQHGGTNLATNGTVVDLNGATLSFTAVMGRQYEVTFLTQLTIATNNNRIQLLLTDSANNILTQSVYIEAVATATQTRSAVFRWVPSAAGATTLKMRGNRVSGSGTDVVVAATATDGGFWVKDIGPQTPGPPPPAFVDTRPPAYAGAGFGTYTDASGEVWVAKATVNGGAWSRARDALHARVWRNAAVNSAAAATFATLTWDAVSFDTYGLYVSPNFVVPVAGMYSLRGQVGATLAASQYVQFQFLRNGAALSSMTLYSPAAVGTSPSGSDTTPCAANDTLSVNWRTQGGGQALTVGTNQSYFAIDYLGTG